MAIQSQTVSVSASFTSISINGNTTRTGKITWKPPSLPEGAVIKSCNVAGDLVISMKRGSATVTINRKNYTSSQAIIVSLGTSITSSLSVKAKGSSMLSNGKVSMKNLVYEVVYEYDDGLANTHNIKIGATTISNIHLGNTKVDKVYIGDILVFEDSNTSDRFTTLLPVDGVIPLTEIPVKTGEHITFEYTQY